MDRFSDRARNVLINFYFQINFKDRDLARE